METKILLSDILEKNNINPEKVLLIRHALSHENCRKCYEKGYIFEYTQLLTSKTMDKYCYWMVFVSTKGTKSKFIGMYKYIDKLDISQKEKLADYPCPEMYSNDHVYYKLEKTDIFEDLNDRLIIDWGTSTQSWYQTAKKVKPVVAIQAAEIKQFPGYDKLVILHDELESIVNDVTDEYREYQNALYAVKGGYLITYTESGQLYVGSASGDDGILGRWKQYANSPYHGGNNKLIELLSSQKEAYKKFKFSILQIFSKTASEKEVRDAEDLFKKKLGSRVFGLNAN